MVQFQQYLNNYSKLHKIVFSDLICQNYKQIKSVNTIFQMCYTDTLKNVNMSHNEDNLKSFGDRYYQYISNLVNIINFIYATSNDQIIDGLNIKFSLYDRDYVLYKVDLNHFKVEMIKNNQDIVEMSFFNLPLNVLNSLYKAIYNGNI